jgi:zinc protease
MAGKPKTPSPSTQPPLLLEPNHSLPLCRVQVTLRTGATSDAKPAPELGLGTLPPGAMAGLCNYVTELQRRGAGGKTRAQLDDAIDALGANVQVLCWHDSVLFEAMALKEHIDAACGILADILARPDFVESESEKLRRELDANLDDLRDDDGSLAGRFFARALYGTHPYALPVGGTHESIARYRVDLARKWFSHHLVAGNVVFGAAGAFREDEAQALLSRHFTGAAKALPPGPQRETDLSLPASTNKSRGKPRVVIVDKPNRTQSQIYMGQLAPHWRDPHYLPLLVGTTAFGGTFTARLMDEVRVKRGLSYGASARLGNGRSARGLVVHVMPSAEQTGETLELILRLYREWAEGGLRPDEVEFSKGYLRKSHAFTIQTADDRLALRTRLLLCDMPQSDVTEFPDHIAQIDGKAIRQAMDACLRPDDLVVTLVATAKNVLPQIAKIPALKGADIDVVPFDSY